MYGYIKFYGDELKIKDLNVFKSYYCGLCRELAEQYGSKSRLLLSYDMTFFALFIDAVNKDYYSSDQYRCPIHLIKKRPMVIDSDGIKKAAMLTILMGVGKLKDDWIDDKKLVSNIAIKLFDGAYKKSIANDVELSRMVIHNLHLFYAGEKRYGISLDELVDPFAKVTAAVLSQSISDIDSQVLYKLGYQCGRWLYFIDALDDLPADFKEGKFNAYLHTLSGEKRDWYGFYRSVRDDIEANLYFSLGEISNIINSLEIKQHRELLMNIFYIGLRVVTDHILYLRDNAKEDKFSDPYKVKGMFKHSEDREMMINKDK